MTVLRLECFSNCSVFQFVLFFPFRILYPVQFFSLFDAVFLSGPASLSKDIQADLAAQYAIVKVHFNHQSGSRLEIRVQGEF